MKLVYKPLADRQFFEQGLAPLHRGYVVRDLDSVGGWAAGVRLVTV